MQMTEAFALLARGTTPGDPRSWGLPPEPPGRRPDADWEKSFAAYQAAGNELDMAKPAAEVLAYFRDVPAVSTLYVAQRLLTVVGAIVWTIVFVLLTLVEVLGLIWLGDGAQPGDQGLAVFSVVTVAIALVALIMAPVLYLFFPLLLPFDVLPEGLKAAVGPKLATERGRGFMRQVMSELEGAMTRASETLVNPPGGAQPPTDVQAPRDGG